MPPKATGSGHPLAHVRIAVVALLSPARAAASHIAVGSSSPDLLPQLGHHVSHACDAGRHLVHLAGNIPLAVAKHDALSGLRDRNRGIRATMSILDRYQLARRAL